MAEVGEIIDRYVVDGILGEGGMGRVYSALDPRLGRRVALKVLLAGGASETDRALAAARMAREARAAAAFNHPNVVAIYDVGEVDGQPFIVMELVAGASLRAYVRDPGVTAAQKMAWLVDVARGLDAAHRAGLVHRDIKPDNVMITPDGVVKILDFGIARRTQGDAPVATGTPAPASIASLTSEGQMLGTPQYMAPEQLTGEPVDGRTDQFAWGVMAWELFAGALPWGPAKSGPQLIAAVLAAPAAPLVDEVPSAEPRFSDVVTRTLSKKRTDRFASMGDVLAALGAARMSAVPAPNSRDMAFEPTAAQTSAPVPAVSGTAKPTLTTAAPISHLAETLAPQRRRRWTRARVGSLAGVLVAIGGVVGGVFAMRAPRVTLCAEIPLTESGLFDSASGPRCLTPVDSHAITTRRRWFRMTSSAGRAQSVEFVTFAGTRVKPNQTRSEIVREADGAVREIITRDPRGNVTGWQRWSDGGRRIDLVDDDGVTPRHTMGSRVTGVRRELDASGAVVREVYVGLGERPRLATDVAYGLAYSARQGDRWTRATHLAADGKPGIATLFGAAQDYQYGEGALPTRDERFLDVEGKPMPDYAGVFHERWRGDWSGEGDLTGSFFGAHDETVVHRTHGGSGEMDHWDGAKRVREGSPVDAKGLPHPYRGDTWATLRQTYDERGREVSVEHLDANRNLVPSRDLEGARFQAVEVSVWNDRDELVELRELDPTGALTPNGDGFARRDQVFDAHGWPVETRYYDETGHLAPRRDGGAIEKTTYDARGLVTAQAYFDASGRPMANARGYAIERRKYDRLRNLVETTRFAADGQPCVDDQGISAERSTYDENDDLVAVAYFDASGAPTMLHGEYATRRMKLDERGLIAEETYFDGHGTPVVLRDGYAMVRYVRDRNDDVTEEAYFGKRGEPRLRAGGYATRRTKYDAWRHPVETALFDAAGAPQIGADGWAIERSTYDEVALLTRRDHFDAAGRPVLTADGSASVALIYDPRGNLVEERALGLDGKPIVAKGGYAAKKSAFDDRDELIAESLFDGDGKPAMGAAGWSIRQLRYDELGNLVDEAFFDVDHRPVSPKGLTYASVRSRFDAHQRLVETAYFDADGAPAKGPEGAESVRYRRDGYGRAVETSYLDGAGTPASSADGKVVVRTKYDSAGRPVEESFVDGAGVPRAARDGCAGHATKYDVVGRKLEESCVDPKGALVVGQEGWAIRRTLHDARGNAVDVTTFGADGAPRADQEGVARHRSRFDERNLLRETRFFDARDRATHDTRGAYGIAMTYDESGKTVEETPVDEKGKPLPPRPAR